MMKRTLRTGIIALALGAAAVLGSSGTASASPERAGHTAKPTIVTVHGAWTDASSFAGVTDILVKDGYQVLDFANPLRSLSGDSASLAAFLKARTIGPVLLVGHSYGGAVVGEAALSDPQVRGLVYVDAFVPDQGESLLALLSSAGPVDPAQMFDMVPYPQAPEGDVDLYLKREAFAAAFANGLPKALQARLYAQQRPITFTAVNEPTAADPAWKKLPSWYVAGTKDLSIPLSLQLSMADRAGSKVTRVDAGHLAMVAAPQTVAQVIEKADRATR